jgi:ATP-dependent Clp protease protease subunit
VTKQAEIPAPETNERNVDALLERLEIIKNYI